MLSICHIVFIIACLGKSLQHDTTSMLNDIRASVLDYEKQIVNMQCLETGWKNDGSNRKFAGRSTAYRTDNNIVIAGRGTAENNQPISTRVSLLRKNNNGFYEHFHFIYAKTPSESPDPSLDFFQNQRDWMLTSEKLYGTDKADYIALQRQSIGILKAQKFADGWNLTIIDLLNSPLNNLDLLRTGNDTVKLVCNIRIGADENKRSSIAHFENCTIIMERKSHWVITSSDYKYRIGYTKNSGVDRLNGSIRIAYTTLNGVAIPSEIDSQVTVVDSNQKQTIEKYTYHMQSIIKYGDDAFALPTYGFPERNLQNKSNEASIAVQDASSVESIPLWGWLAGAGMAFLLASLFIMGSSRRTSGRKLTSA